MITVLRNNQLIAVYKDGKLVSTGDKFTSKADFETLLSQLNDPEIKESVGTFTTYTEIPEVLPTGKGNKAPEAKTA